MVKCQKDPTCGIFLKIYDEVPERPEMLYIFEKRIVQRYKKCHEVKNVMKCQMS